MLTDITDGKHKLTITPFDLNKGDGPFDGGYFLCTNKLKSKFLKEYFFVYFRVKFNLSLNC